ncbi:MAG: polysaccharide deacetylase family protein [Acidimicrobiales bacterium]|nr:polysaccharide deacetylase family protein [Acidimicrobiales bacterium]
MPGAARKIVKRVAAVLDVVAPPPPGITILIYHRVGRRSAIEVDLPAGLFADQMAWLREHCDLVTLDEVLDRLPGPAPTDRSGEPRRPVVAVTFDDGTADFVSDALPVLTAHRVPVTLYVATDFIERGRAFPDDGIPLSWAALADAVSTGLVTVGSHTHTHALLDRADPEAVCYELDRSCDLIATRLGVHAEHFAYPKAVPGSSLADREVRRRFRSAALAGTRPNAYGATDPYRLSRAPVQFADDMAWFERKAAGGMRAEDVVRRVVNRWRYRGKSS